MGQTCVSKGRFLKSILHLNASLKRLRILHRPIIHEYQEVKHLILVTRHLSSRVKFLTPHPLIFLISHPHSLSFQPTLENLFAILPCKFVIHPTLKWFCDYSPESFCHPSPQNIFVTLPPNFFSHSSPKKVSFHPSHKKICSPKPIFFGYFAFKNFYHPTLY